MFVPPKPPVPAAPLPFRQFFRSLRANALATWPAAAYEQPFIKRNMFGRMNFVMNDAAGIYRVLVDNPGNYRRSPAAIRILRPIAGQGLLLAEGDNWKLQRRTVAPALAPRTIPLLTRHIIATTDEALDELQARIHAPIDMLATMQNLTLEIAGRSMFSLEMAQYGADMRRMLAEYAIDHAKPRMLDLLLPTAIPTPGDFGRRRFQKRWMGLIAAIVHDRLRMPEPEQPRDLFDLLRAARDPETAAGFDAEQLRDQVATLILAGHETTAISLFWSLTLLAQDREEQQKLADNPQGRTRAVFNEAMRLFPPAYLIVREAIGPDTVAGQTIHRGDVLMISPWIIHRHRALWHDPDTFDPSRFLPDMPAPPRFSYLPFGAGPRICVGAQFALTEATIVLSAIVKRFDISLESTRPVLPVGAITTKPDHAPAFRLRLR
ncbi:MAG: cytochrome P450 [Rhodospirillales bacterium]